MTHPRTGEAAIPRIPGDRFLDGSSDERTEFARWLTSHNNPYFAKAIVNRLWKSLMGRGLVEPADDFRDTNPATHPELLNRLAEDFVESGYDLRHALRRISLSAAYARSSNTLPGNAADDRFYSHALVQPLEPEVLADAITDVLDLPEQYGDQPVGTRAVTLFDPKIPSESLDILGRCDREDTCESVVSTSGGLPQMLHMFNGRLINERISDPDGRLAQLVASRQPPHAIIDEMYQRALGRRPAPQEQDFWSRQLASAAGSDEMRAMLEDIVWSLVTCREFGTNH